MVSPHIVQEHPGFGRVIVRPKICDGCGILEKVIVRGVLKMKLEDKFDGCDLFSDGIYREEGWWWTYRHYRPNLRDDIDEDYCPTCVRNQVSKYIFLKHLEKEGNKECAECLFIKGLVGKIHISSSIPDIISENYNCEHSGYVKAQLAAALILSNFSDNDMYASFGPDFPVYSAQR